MTVRKPKFDRSENEVSPYEVLITHPVSPNVTLPFPHGQLSYSVRSHHGFRTLAFRFTDGKRSATVRKFRRERTENFGVRTRTFRISARAHFGFRTVTLRFPYCQNSASVRSHIHLNLENKV